MAEFQIPQTSFVPKKPIVEESSYASKKTKRVNPLMSLIYFIFIIIILVTGGLYFYKSILIKNLNDIEANIKKMEESIDELLIVDMQKFSKRVDIAQKILDNHLAVSPIFKLLQENTLKTVRFNKFNYSFDENNLKANIEMTGQASSYSTLALQAKVFGDLEYPNSREKIIKDLVFSDLEVNQRGQVTFKVNFSIDKNFILYKNNLINF